jgi:uncharacterized phage protein gp47/JayE
VRELGQSSPPAPPRLNGIDFLEVGPDQVTLEVNFVHELAPLPASPPIPVLSVDNVLIEGGVRIRNVQVESVAIAGRVLTVIVNGAGDFSTYTLRLVQSPFDLVTPPGFDPQLSQVEFSFKVDCPSEFDCAPAVVCPEEPLAEPEINYLAKDFASFSRLMLDRLNVLMPGWRERNAADALVALVELLAYVGDHLSYFQDAVATEAYLGTARRRVSIRRHARLLDYFMHDGCNARAWVHLEVEPGGNADGMDLPAGVMLLAGLPEAAVLAPEELAHISRDGLLVFETLHTLALNAAHNRLRFYTWSDAECCLPRGSTRATLQAETGLSLQVGDFLLFEEVRSPATGAEADADPAHRHVVRLTAVELRTDPLDDTPVLDIEWTAADALPFPLCISVLVEGPGGSQLLPDAGVARGNLVLADHGRTIRDEPLLPAVVDRPQSYRPRLAQGPLTHQGPVDLTSAATAMSWEMRSVRPFITLASASETWTPQFDLLGSDRFATEFVVETEANGTAALRFGDDVLGRQPNAGAAFTATYRAGNGRAGNVGAEAIATLVLAGGGITLVRNPLAAAGGQDPESQEVARLAAPHAFRTQERAVTEADYAEVAQRNPRVQKAAATVRWTGSWHTVFVTVDRKGGEPVDAEFEDEMRAYLDRYRIAGYDLEIDGPVFVPLDIKMSVCVKPGYFRSDVKQALLDVFSNREFPNRIRGFFHPDNFTFGQPLFLSQVYHAAMQAAGVASVLATKFQRWDKAANRELENAVLTVGTLEIVRLDNDRNFPENGRIEFVMEGGL